MIDLLADGATDLRPAAPEDVERMRAAAVQAAVFAFRRHAFHEVDYETVAAQTDLDVDEVRAVFPDWYDLVGTTLRQWYAERMGPLLPIAEQGGAVALLRAVVVANVADPGLMRLLSAMVNIAATPQHPMAGTLQQEWLHFYALVQRTLIRDVELGREPSTIDCARGSEQLIALYEGLQLQAMVRPGMRLLESFDRAVTRLREGWAQVYTPPVWQV